MTKKKVMLVDDEKSFTNLLKLNLEETGNYEVRVENWAEDAVNAAKEFRPDIILLDIIMPRMPGGNVAALIKETPQLRDPPCVSIRWRKTAASFAISHASPNPRLWKWSWRRSRNTRANSRRQSAKSKLYQRGRLVRAATGEGSQAGNRAALS